MGKIFSKAEIKFLTAMGLVLGMRELSMTMLNPFISIYGATLIGSTTFLCGLAMGIYGLTNAIFQIPYGIISDRYGRKPVILLGLVQLAAGLLLSYITSNIYVFILARALQGSGAVMAIAYSWIGDRISDEKKSSAMGIAGIVVAMGAVTAFAVGPVLYKAVSLKNMFLGCAVIILFSGLFIMFFIKEDRKNYEDKRGISFIYILKDKKIVKLSICGFIFNYVMSEMFFIVPAFLNNTIGAGNMWMVFMPGVIIGILCMLTASGLADKGHFKGVSISAYTALLIGSVLIAFKTLVCNTMGTFLILSGFMVLTSGIPSAINKSVDSDVRGGANGILQTATFLGFFAGPTVTGLLLEKVSICILQLIPMLLSILGILLIWKEQCAVDNVCKL